MVRKKQIEFDDDELLESIQEEDSFDDEDEFDEDEDVLSEMGKNFSNEWVDEDDEFY